VTISWTHSLWLIHKKDRTIGERDKLPQRGTFAAIRQDGG